MSAHNAMAKSKEASAITDEMIACMADSSCEKDLCEMENQRDDSIKEALGHIHDASQNAAELSAGSYADGVPDQFGEAIIRH